MGIAIMNIATSAWLLVFSMFFFFSLSMAKRTPKSFGRVRAP